MRYKYAVTGGDLVVFRKEIKISKERIFAAFETILQNHYQNDEQVGLSDYDNDYAVYILPIFQRLGFGSEVVNNSRIT